MSSIQDQSLCRTQKIMPYPRTFCHKYHVAVGRNEACFLEKTEPQWLSRGAEQEEVKELRKISRFKHRSSSLHQLRSSAKSSVGHLLHVTQCQLSGQSQYDPKLGGPNFSAHRVRNIHSAWGKFHERLLKPLLDFRDRPASAKSAQRTIRQQSITTSKTSQNGSSSLQGKGHFCLRHPLLPQPPRLAQDHPRAGR